jgi:hypothetical protein
MFGPIALWAYMINMPGRSHSGRTSHGSPDISENGMLRATIR